MGQGQRAQARPSAAPDGQPAADRRGERLTRLQRVTYRVWFAVGMIVLAAVSFALLYRPLAVILAPLLVALLIVYLLDPIVSWLRRRRVPRLVGAAVAYLLVAGAVTLGTIALTPAVATQLAEFAEAAPELGETLQEQTQGVVDALGLDVDVGAQLASPQLIDQLQEFAAEAENRQLLLAGLGGLFGVARGALYLLTALLLGPVIAFYILVDLPNLRRITRNLVPPHYRDEVAAVAAKLGNVVGGFVRGQLIIACGIGVAASIALAIVGLPYWLLVGIIAGVTNIIPLLGPLVAGIIAFAIAFVTEGLGFAVLVAVVMTAVQQLDGQLMSPLIMGKTVRVHPLAVLLGIIVAGALFGVLGMLVVVPLIAGAKVLAQHLWHTRVPWASVGDDQRWGGAEPAGTVAVVTDDEHVGAAPEEQPPLGADAPDAPEEGADHVGTQPRAESR